MLMMLPDFGFLNGTCEMVRWRLWRNLRQLMLMMLVVLVAPDAHDAL